MSVRYKIIDETVAEFKQYEKAQDPLLHYEDAWNIAYGDGWYARVVSRGEIRAYKDGERIRGDEIVDHYPTDDKLHEAEESGELIIENNNWYEVEFFADLENGTEYLDLLSDNCVCFSFDEAWEIFYDYINSDSWCEELMKAVGKVRKEQNV